MVIKKWNKQMCEFLIEIINKNLPFTAGAPKYCVASFNKIEREGSACFFMRTTTPARKLWRSFFVEEMNFKLDCELISLSVDWDYQKTLSVFGEQVDLNIIRAYAKAFWAENFTENGVFKEIFILFKNSFFNIGSMIDIIKIEDYTDEDGSLRFKIMGTPEQCIQSDILFENFSEFCAFVNGIYSEYQKELNARLKIFKVRRKKK